MPPELIQKLILDLLSLNVAMMKAMGDFIAEKSAPPEQQDEAKKYFRELTDYYKESNDRIFETYMNKEIINGPLGPTNPN